MRCGAIITLGILLSASVVDAGSLIRVTKALASRGYDQVRVSLITYNGAIEDTPRHTVADWALENPELAIEQFGEHVELNMSEGSPTASGFGKPPCSGSQTELVPKKCGKSPTGPPAGQAEGSYCADGCSHDGDCAYVSGLQAACSMNMGDGRQFCEYKCSSDSSCPSGAKCEKNIVSSICTYPSAPSPTPPPGPGPSPAPPPSPGGDIAWTYDAQFEHRWKDCHIKSAVFQVTPGVSQSFKADGTTINIRVPAENAGSVGLIIGDPCITQDAYCLYGNTFAIKDTLHRVINGLSQHELDYWMLNGDLFYDQSGHLTKEFSSGLSLDAQGKISAVTMGNHDYWIGGSPSGQSRDSFGNGHMQWWAQDTLSAKNDPSKPFDFSQNPDSHKIIDIDNTFWYNKIGNVAFIGFSNAYDWNSHEAKFQEACAWVGSAHPSALIILGHWNYQGLGCPSGMGDPDVYGRVTRMSGCSGIKTKFIEGHKHCNSKQNNGNGFLLGANGFKDGDGSCTGAFGIPILDTRNNALKLWYFKLAERTRRSGDFEAKVSCLEKSGLDACLHYAENWIDEDISDMFKVTSDAVTIV